MKALKTAVYTFNWVPFRVVPKTPKLRNMEPSLNCSHIWGCPANVRIYNPHLRKLDSMTTSGIL